MARRALLLLLLLLLAAPVWADNPRTLVENLYSDWFHDKGHRPAEWARNHRGDMMPELYTAFQRAMDLTPDKDGTFFDCDALFGTQEETFSYSVERAQVTNDRAIVPVYVRLGATDRDSYIRPLRVMLRNWHGSWRLDDIAYTPTESLRSTCRELLKEARK